MKQTNDNPRNQEAESGKGKEDDTIHQEGSQGPVTRETLYRCAEETKGETEKAARNAAENA
jgi:hypothetical protein